MQLEARQVHIPRSRGHIQETQDETEPSRMAGLDLGRIAGTEEKLQPLVPEPADRHLSTVTRTFTGYKPPRPACLIAGTHCLDPDSEDA